MDFTTRTSVREKRSGREREKEGGEGEREGEREGGEGGEGEREGERERYVLLVVDTSIHVCV